MDLPVMLREALELLVSIGALKGKPTAVAFRRMVSITDEAFDLAELLTQLALDGAVPEHRLELLTDILTAAAATAGGIRPSVDALQNRLGDQDLLFGAWLGILTGLRVASLAMEATETELLEDVLLAFELFTEEQTEI